MSPTEYLVVPCLMSAKRVPERLLRSLESNEILLARVMPPPSREERMRLLVLKVELPGKDASSVSLAIGAKLVTIFESNFSFLGDLSSDFSGLQPES